MNEMEWMLSTSILSGCWPFVQLSEAATTPRDVSVLSTSNWNDQNQENFKCQHSIFETIDQLRRHQLKKVFKNGFFDSPKISNINWTIIVPFEHSFQDFQVGLPNAIY